MTIRSISGQPRVQDTNLENVGATEEVTNSESPLGPPRRLTLESIPEESLSNYNIGLLLALAISEGYVQLRRQRQQEARLFLEGELAMVTAMMRLEPRVAAFIENVQILKSHLNNAVTVGTTGMSLGGQTSAGAKVKDAFKKATEKTGEAAGKLIARSPFKTNALDRAGGALAKRLARSPLSKFQFVRDRLLLRSELARKAIALNRAEVMLRGQEFKSEAARTKAIKAKAAELEPVLVKEALARHQNERINGRDWPLDRGSDAEWRAQRREEIAQERYGKTFEKLDSHRQGQLNIQLNNEQMTRAVFGDNFTEDQLRLVDRAATRLTETLEIAPRSRTGSEFGDLLGDRKHPALPDRAAFADFLEQDPAFAKSADGPKILQAIRDEKVDLSIGLQDENGQYGPRPPESVAKTLLNTAISEVNREFETGWADSAHGTEALAEGRQTREAIFNAWFQEYLAEQQQILVRIGEMSDVVADAYANSIGGSYD